MAEKKRGGVCLVFQNKAQMVLLQKKLLEERTHCHFKMSSYVQNVQETHWEGLQMLPWRPGTIPDMYYLLLSTVRVEIGPHSQIE